MGEDTAGCGSSRRVISHAFWQRNMAASLISSAAKITLEGHPFPIIGVTPPGFFGVEIGRSYDVAVRSVPNQSSAGRKAC